MADGSTKVVYAALAGNLLVALSKFVAAAWSGSSAMLTEAIHSCTDCANQLLLLLGNWRSRTAPDRSHPFGYGAEIYFWASIVAVMVLVAGGVVSLYQGALKLLHPEALHSPGLSLGVLALASIFEGGSLGFSLREYRRLAAKRPLTEEEIGLWQFIKMSKDPNLYESLLEDLAALAGILIAALGVMASAWWQAPWADGLASMLIGLLLVGISWVIAEATRRLVAGEPVTAPLQRQLGRALKASGDFNQLRNIRTLHLGPRTILFTATLLPRAGLSALQLKAQMDELTARIRCVDGRFEYVFFDLGESG